MRNIKCSTNPIIVGHPVGHTAHYAAKMNRFPAKLQTMQLFTGADDDPTTIIMNTLALLRLLTCTDRPSRYKKGSMHLLQQEATGRRRITTRATGHLFAP